VRSPYEIYQKYKYLQKKAIANAINSLMSTEPQNCLYNKKVDMGVRGSVRLCTLGAKMSPVMETGGLLVCETCSQALSCSAYAPRVKSREEALSILADELKDPVIKREKFPEVVALEWVMDNELHELKKEPPTWKHRMVLKVIGFQQEVLVLFNKLYRSLGKK
jgi:hypothetical protein